MLGLKQHILVKTDSSFYLPKEILHMKLRSWPHIYIMDINIYVYVCTFVQKVAASWEHHRSRFAELNVTNDSKCRRVAFKLDLPNVYAPTYTHKHTRACMPASACECACVCVHIYKPLVIVIDASLCAGKAQCHGLCVS